MEIEYTDNSRRGKVIIAVGVVLALVAGGAAFYLVNQAQQQAGQVGLERVTVVVAKQTIPGRKPIEAGEVDVREVPIDPSNAQGVVSSPDLVVGRVAAVTILEGQLITTNLLASSETGSQFSILGPEETVAPDSEAWRAVSITVSDTSAVGGLVQANMTVDVFMTATVNVPAELISEGRYYVDKATKITYQDMLILTRIGTSYVIRVSLAQAEEILHLQAAGNVTFSMALRPESDTRIADSSKLGATTNVLIQRYGLPLPEVYPPAGGPPLAGAPRPTPTPLPTDEPLPGESPASSELPLESASPAP